ncbi:NmrA family NAD(P)-binding protein [Nocardia sp. NPDC056000]|uniref:NmrA family NAD(P)-binding protein n=1 Tax=Nocardia sp. NPDC056000 TaxID=3345674 RepID=UPI0035D90891
MIVVMGASSATGSALVRGLAALGRPSRALTRDPERLRAELSPATLQWTEIHPADATDPATLRAAFTDARQLFLTMTNGPRQIELENRCIDIAAATGIEHIVKLSAPAAEPGSPVTFSRWHHAIEEQLRASRMEHTILRPYAFMQKLLTLAPGIAARSLFTGAMGTAACNYIDCRDIADVAAAVFTRPELTGRTYTLTGTEAITHAELATRLTRLLGHPIRYLDLPPTAFRDSLIREAGMPPWLATHVMEIQQLAVTRPEHPTDTVTRLLGSSPRTLDDFLRENLELFRRQ